MNALFLISNPELSTSMWWPNNWVQATPDYACYEFVRQEPGAPDAER